MAASGVYKLSSILERWILGLQPWIQAKIGKCSHSIDLPENSFQIMIYKRLQDWRNCVMLSLCVNIVFR